MILYGERGKQRRWLLIRNDVAEQAAFLIATGRRMVTDPHPAAKNLALQKGPAGQEAQNDVHEVVMQLARLGEQLFHPCTLVEVG
jgi:hypothetical protein